MKHGIRSIYQALEHHLESTSHHTDEKTDVSKILHNSVFLVSWQRSRKHALNPTAEQTDETQKSTVSSNPHPFQFTDVKQIGFLGKILVFI